MSFENMLKGKNIVTGEKLDAESLIVAQKVLCNMGLDFIPRSYADFLHKYNGAKYEDACLFGATVEDDLDIIDQNEQTQKPENTILLGCNDFDFLCYDYKKKQYQIVDRTDFEVLDTFEDDEVEDAICEIFNV